MELGVLSSIFNGYTLQEACAYLASRRVSSIEVAAGGVLGKKHCDPARLLEDDKALAAFSGTIQDYGLSISALSAHGNMLHPSAPVARRYEEDLTAAVLLAERLGVPVVNTFSGCPGGSAKDQTPNWVTCRWPEDYSRILDYQWEEVLIPYWKQKAEFAARHGVKIAIEMHPGFCVYNVDTLLRLREAAGSWIGVNFDPSHLIWQGTDPCAAIRVLGEERAIYHFHAKDTRMDAANTSVNGVLDTNPAADLTKRSWMFRTVGYGHDAGFWKDILTALRMAGYDGVLSIEHEDPLMSVTEGLDKGIAFLKDMIYREDVGRRAFSE